MNSNSRFFCGLRPRCLPLFSVALTLFIFVPGSEIVAGVLIGIESSFATPTGPFMGNDSQNDSINVGTLTFPIPVQPKIGGNPWVKEFVVNRDGQGWSTSGPDSMITITEALSINGVNTLNPLAPPRVIDWHEDIDPTFGDGANFKWVGGTLTIPGPIGVVPGPYTGTVSADGKSIWFDFPPLPIVPILITKQLMWAGAGPITPGPNGTNTYRISVIERPSVPEPTSLLLAGLAAGCAVGPLARRRKR
jgi:PEP-CTERM motif